MKRNVSFINGHGPINGFGANNWGSFCHFMKVSVLNINWGTVSALLQFFVLDFQLKQIYLRFFLFIL